VCSSDLAYRIYINGLRKEVVRRVFF